jgi:hypothetical protein
MPGAPTEESAGWVPGCVGRISCVRAQPGKTSLITPQSVISRERRTALAGAPYLGRDREIYRRDAGGRLRCSALALSGLVSTACLVRAAAFGHAVAESRFLGPATRVASRKCSAAGPRNDTSVFITLAACGAERLNRKPSRSRRTVISRERRTALAGATYLGRDREIYRRDAGGRLRRPALAPVRPCRGRPCGAGYRVWPRGSRE